MPPVTGAVMPILVGRTNEAATASSEAAGLAASDGSVDAAAEADAAAELAAAGADDDTSALLDELQADSTTNPVAATNAIADLFTNILQSQSAVVAPAT